MDSENIKISAIDSTNLLDYQVPHTTTMLEAVLNNRRVLDASDTGTGKTYTSCSIAYNLELPIGIICTKASRGEWTQALKYFGLKPEFMETYEMLRDRETKYTKFVTIENRTRFQFNLPKEFILFIDEEHRCKGLGTFNARLLKRVREAGCYAVALSATPATTPLEMDALGYFLGLHNGVGFYTWAKKHGCDQAKHHRGLVYYGKQDYMKQIHSYIFPKLGSRMRVADIKGFPESSIQFTCVDVDNPPIYDDCLKAREIDFMQRGLQSGEHLSALVDYRRLMELQKVPIIVDKAKDLIEQGHSVPIFVNFRETANAISEELDCYQINGDVKESDRVKYQTLFQTESVFALVLTAGSGGESISLHDLNGRRSRVSLICPIFSAIKLKQIFGRVWRAGSKSKSVQKLIFASNSLEAQMCFKIQEKLDRLELLTDGDLAAGDPLTFKQWKEKYENTTGKSVDSTTCESFTIETRPV